jgi:hypothetical protein
MLHAEVTRFWSRGVITVFTDARTHFDVATNSLVKLGQNLKVGDIIFEKLDREGKRCSADQRWKVIELVYTKLLGIDDLIVGEEYGVYYQPEKSVLPFRLSKVDLERKIYHFESSIVNLNVGKDDLPSVYPYGTEMTAHGDVHKILIESVEPNCKNMNKRSELLMSAIKSKSFAVDVGNTHIVEAIGYV